MWLQFSNKEYLSKMAVEILSLLNRGYKYAMVLAAILCSINHINVLLVYTESTFRYNMCGQNILILVSFTIHISIHLNTDNSETNALG